MKKLNFKLIISLISSLIIIFLFFIYFEFSSDKLIKEDQNLEIKEDNFTNSNIIKDIEYSSKDLKGNEYVILSNEGEIDLNNNDIIFLKNVTAYIKMLKNNETITIVSEFGKYNTINYDTIFSKNVKINYLNNQITSDYLDFSMIKNILIISKNVVYTNPENILKADVIELDTITKDTKIFMYNAKNKVNIKSRN
tara:strand:- start:15 stop:599 length:585 start_codon:yes stop_codon:yes gene_type:complete